MLKSEVASSSVIDMESSTRFREHASLRGLLSTIRLIPVGRHRSHAVGICPVDSESTVSRRLDKVDNI